MGQKEDTVVELDPTVRIWVDKVLPEIGMKPTESGNSGPVPETVTPKEEAPKGPTPAEVMLKSVSAPRPPELSVPTGANGEETNAIESLFTQLVQNLQTHDGGEDLSAATTLVSQIKDAVAQVPERIKREIEDKRKDLLSALSNCKVPDGLPVEEKTRLEQRIANYRSIAEKATAMGPLKSLLEEGMPVLEENIRKAGEDVTRRTKAAEALRDRIGKAAPPDLALPEEATPLRERGEKLLERLAPPLTDTGLEGVATDTGLLEQDAQKLRETVLQRGEKAVTLRERLQKIAANPGLPGDEISAFGQKVTQAIQALKEPYTPGMLDTAEKAAVDLELEVQQQATAVSDRSLRAQKLQERLDKIKAPARVMPEEAETLRLAVEEAAKGLTAPHAVLTLDGVEGKAGELEGKVVTLAQTVVKRDERGKAVSLRMTQLVDPPGLNDDEKSKMKDAREAASLLLTDPPTEKGVGDAEAKATEAENLGKTIEKAISDRADKRKELNDAIDKIDIPATARPEDFRLHAKLQAGLRQQIKDANTTETLTKAEEAVKAEETAVADMANFLSERTLAEQAIAAARQMLKDESQTADQGFLAKLQSSVVEAARKLETLTDKASATKLIANLKLVTDRLAESKTYADDLRKFLFSASLRAKETGAAPAVKDAIEKVRLAAQAKAASLEYKDARGELAKFETEAGLPVGVMAETDTWQNTLKAFDGTYGAKLALIAKTKAVMPTPTLIDQVKAARVTPVAGADLVAAAKTLNDLGPNIDDMAKLAEAWALFLPLKTNASPPTSAIDLAFFNAQTELAALKYADAASKFAGLSGSADEKKQLAKARLSKLQSRNGNLSVISSDLDPAKNHIKTTYLTPANTKITGNDIPAANGLMDSAEKIMNDTGPWLVAHNEVKALLKAYDDTNANGFATTAINKATAFKFDEALPLLGTAATNLRALGEYQAQLKRAEALRDTLKPSTPPHNACLLAITEAGKKVTAKDPAEGVKLLLALFADPGLKTMAADIDVWLKRHPAIDKATKAVAGKIVQAAPKKALEDSLAAAVLQATAGKYREALDLLDAHEPLLGQAKDYVRALGLAEASFKGLERAAKEFPTEETNIFLGGKPAVQKKLTDANVLAAKTDFLAATKAFEQFLKDCETMAGNAAKLFEQKDGTGTNAGHSLDRHGPDVSDGDLLRRLQTGIAPDNKRSETAASSKFEDMTAWLAGREKAIAEVEKKRIDGKNINLADTSYDISKVTDADLGHLVTVDHGGAIDKAFAGIKPNKDIAPDGTEEEAGTFESFEELNGITKSISNVIFVINPPEGSGPSPRNINAYKERFKKEMERLNNEDLANWNDNVKTPPPKPPQPTPRGTVPTDIPGKWVMMQHFPLVKGWDQEKGDYIA